MSDDRYRSGADSLGGRIGRALIVPVFWYGLAILIELPHLFAGGLTGNPLGDLLMLTGACLALWWIAKRLLDAIFGVPK